jgi:hypothetical protein
MTAPRLGKPGEYQAGRGMKTVKVTSDRARTAGRARAMANRGKYQMYYNWETGTFDRKKVK